MALLLIRDSVYALLISSPFGYPGPEPVRAREHQVRCLSCTGRKRVDPALRAQCGSPLPSPCLACGFENEAAAKFCGGCGRPIGELAAQNRQHRPHSLARIAPSGGS
jgi:hypothetical protein